MNEAVDGEYQAYKARNGAYVREHFFGRYPELREMVADWSDDADLGAQPRRPRPVQGLRRLRRGGRTHGPPDRDPRQDDQGLRDGRGRRGPEHHPPAEEDDERARCSPSATASSCRSPTSRSPRARSTSRRRPPGDAATCTSAARRSGGYLPRAAARPSRCRCPRSRPSSPSSRAPASARSRRRWRSSGSSPRSLRDKQLGRHVVPIVPDESRTFGMEGMFRQLGIFSQLGSCTSPRTASS